MRPSKFTEAQMLQALQDVKCGAPAVDVCRKLGITQTTFYRWRSRYEGATRIDLRERRELRDENDRLKLIVANLLLERERMAELRGKK